MAETAPAHDDLGSTREDKVWTFVLLAGGGVVLLTLGPLLAEWLAGVPFVPFKAQLEWVGSFDSTWQWLARGALGLVAGLVLAFLELADEWRLEVYDDAVVVVHDEDRRRLSREAIVGIHLDGKKVVIDGDHGRRLFEKPVDAPRARIRDAFTSRAYPFENE